MKNYKLQYFIENVVMHLLFIVLALMIYFDISIIIIIVFVIFIYLVYRYFEKLKKDGRWYVAKSDVPWWTFVNALIIGEMLRLFTNMDEARYLVFELYLIYVSISIYYNSFVRSDEN